MAKQKVQKADDERDARIDEEYAKRLNGGDDEGMAWGKAFLGAAQSAAPELTESEDDGDDQPLTEQEKTALRDLMLHAAEKGDHEALDSLGALAGNPAELRRVMSEFSPA